MARMVPQSSGLSFRFSCPYSGTDYRVLGFNHPYNAATTGYVTITNAATGNAPSISFTSTSSPRYLVIQSTEPSNVLLNISGVDYVKPTTNNTYLKTTGAGSTYWE